MVLFEFDLGLLAICGGWNLVKFGVIELDSFCGFKAALFEPASVFVVNSGWSNLSVFVPTRGVNPDVLELALVFVGNSGWGLGFSLFEPASVLLASCGCGLLKLAVTASASFESDPVFFTV